MATAMSATMTDIQPLENRRAKIKAKDRYVAYPHVDIGVGNRRIVHATDRPEDRQHMDTGLPLPPSPIQKTHGIPIPMEDPNYPQALGTRGFPKVIFHTTMGNITFEVSQLSLNPHYATNV